MASEIKLRKVIYPWEIVDETFSALIDRQISYDLYFGDGHWPYRDIDHLSEEVL
jgi:hypothetical protein